MTKDKETENSADLRTHGGEENKPSEDKEKSGRKSVGCKSKEPDRHLGHRERMRSKADEIEFEFMEEHEQLEMILYTAEKVKNTNDIAHDLLKAFGSLGNVLMATKEELKLVKGVGNAMAEFITRLPSFVGLFERAAMEKNKRIRLLTEQDAICYARTLFYDKNVENVYMISLTASGYVCGVSRLSAGIRNSADVTIHKIAAAAIRHGAYEIILTHNHPSGDSTPSIEDLQMTRMVHDGLAALKIRLKMHVIVTSGQCEIINEAGMNMNRFRGLN